MGLSDQSVKYLGNVIIQAVCIVCITAIVLRYNHDLKFVGLILIGQFIGINTKGILDLKSIGVLRNGNSKAESGE
jgi:hypothetical protein